MSTQSRQFGILALIFSIAVVSVVMSEEAPPADRRAAAKAAFDKGNFKDAYEAYRKLALDSADEPKQVGSDLTQALACLNQLGRQSEMDEFREGVIAAHAKNWRLLEAAAQSFLQGPQFGYIIAGKFERGHHRGGGEIVNSTERDRVRAMQLMQQGMAAARADDDKQAASQYLFQFAQLLLNHRGYYDAWRLQVLSDLSTLPDYDQGYYYYRYGQEYPGAPVDEEGKPVYHQLPKSWEDAKTDGERWRWLLEQAAEIAPNRRTEIRKHFADFLWGQFGVQTMGDYGRILGRFAEDDGGDADDGEKKDESGTYALHTLGEDETIARLANGIKRFKLPDEFNFVKIYREVSDADKDTHCEQSLTQLCQIFENRRQYPKAAELWRAAIEKYGKGDHEWRQKRLDQIVGNWGRFEPGQTQAEGKGATVDFRFRNGKQVSFEAHAIHVDTLLDDVKAYIKTRPQRLEWEKLNIQNIGHRLVHQNEKKYIGAKVAEWKLDLEPRPNHYDKRITVTTPLQKPGAYLVRAKMADGDNAKGNTNFIVLWIADTAIVKKPIQGQTLYYVADSTSGTPIAKANVEFFGYRQRYVQNGRRYEIDIKNFAEFTSGEGQVRLGNDRLPQDHQWLIIARSDKGRFSYLGFDNVWYANYQDGAYNEKKVFAISDRPVYRPAQPVKFNFWAGRARYDAPEDKSEFAGLDATVTINNPKGEKVLEKKYKLDDYAGLHDEWMLPADATLGQYYAQIVVHRGGNNDFGGYLQFRVEEYKKPEFEVTVEAPKEPVKLGEKVKAKIIAKYYFGSPVTEAKVKYKVLRSSHRAEWFPWAPWDWFYGSGYWWWSYDYTWYPGWAKWGCWRPYPWWYGGRWEQPELIAEREAEIGEDGTLEFEIDTAPAKAVHGDQDHKYSITAEVVDQSRRTIVGTGEVLVARRPFKVFAWIDRGYVKTGDTIEASFNAQTLDQQPVKGDGTLRLLKISYKDGGDPQPVETEVGKWDLATGDDGRASQKLTMKDPGQYRLSYEVVDSKGNRIEGGYVFTVIGQGFDGGDLRFNDLELIPDKREYSPGDVVKLQINTNRAGGTVLLFMRPVNGVCPPPKLIKMDGKSHVEDVAVVKNDMPNFFVEAVTVAGGRVFSEAKEIVVPPEKRIANVEIKPSATEYKPGEKAKFVVKITDLDGRPFIGSTVISMYDKAVEYISGGTNVPEIKEFFWKWRRHYHSYVEHNLTRYIQTIVPPGAEGMNDLGVFGASVVEELADEFADDKLAANKPRATTRGGFGGGAPGAPMAETAAADGALALGGELRKNALADEKRSDRRAGREQQSGQGAADLATPTVRQNFADTAYWAAGITTNSDGVAEFALDMPENLTTWKCKVWSIGHGPRVGEAATEVVTRKNVIVRLQAPRFFVQKDEVVLSANVHNYLKTDKDIRVVLKLDGDVLAPLDELSRVVSIQAGGERRVDWRVRATREGEATIQMQALTDEESDATQMKFPVFVHGIAKTDSYSGAIRTDETAGSFTVRVPEERRPEESRLEVRYSPTLAGAMVDALPYLAEYPYGCTEQTLNRFLPTVITQKILLDMKLDLKAIQEKRTNLNAQEIGDDKERAKGWKRFDRNPVFDEEEVRKMVKDGVDRLTEMQLSDGGWGWFSGYYEQSTPHTTAVVVHGLQVAKANDVALVPGMLERGVKWLENYQNEQVQKIKNAPAKKHPWKDRADEIDAFVFMVLTDAGVKNADMLGFLDRDRVKLAVYAKALFGLACHTLGEKDKLAVVMENLSQYVVHDDENQTAYLKLPADNYWWYWYGSENEAMAYYLKLLAKLDPKSKTASGLVKYLLNNRKHATYWNSTRDTSLCIEAMADYLKASGEARPDMTVEVWVDGKKAKDVRITAENLFTFDNKFVLTGTDVKSGSYKIELKKQGTGPLYYNGYLTNFTLEDPITKAGLEIKVERRYHKLVRVEKSVKAQGSRGQAVDQKVEKFDRVPLENLATVKSGDVIEIELEIESKNDYEYILFEDMKAAGCEPYDVRSGYGGKGLPAYIELRDNRVALFLRQLARGKHSIAYKMRAEIPGTFSALPTRASAMYAPELKANSDEIKLKIED